MGHVCYRADPAVRVVDVRFPAVLGGFTLSSRHDGPLAGKAVPDPEPTFTCRLER